MGFFDILGKAGKFAIDAMNKTTDRQMRSASKSQLREMMNSSNSQLAAMARAEAERRHII